MAPRTRPLLPVILCLLVSAMGCGSLLSPESSNKPLTPARQLEGTWKSAIALPLTYATDFCGAYQSVATSKWDVTWTLTAVEGFTNVLDVEMRYTTSSQTKLNSQCGSGSNGWFSLPSPVFLRMTVSSSAFTATDQNNGISVSGSYTTSLMNGTWIRKDCIIYCVGEFSPALEFKLVKQ